MGLHLKPTIAEAALSLSKEEVNKCVKQFQRIDVDKKDYITVNDLRRHLKVCEVSRFIFVHKHYINILYCI